MKNNTLTSSMKAEDYTSYDLSGINPEINEVVERFLIIHRKFLAIDEATFPFYSTSPFLSSFIGFTKSLFFDSSDKYFEQYKLLIELEKEAFDIRKKMSLMENTRNNKLAKSIFYLEQVLNNLSKIQFGLWGKACGGGYLRQRNEFQEYHQQVSELDDKERYFVVYDTYFRIIDKNMLEAKSILIKNLITNKAKIDFKKISKFLALLLILFLIVTSTLYFKDSRQTILLDENGQPNSLLNKYKEHLQGEKFWLDQYSAVYTAVDAWEYVLVDQSPPTPENKVAWDNLRNKKIFKLKELEQKILVNLKSYQKE